MEVPNGKILVVDDDRLNRIKLTATLETAGYEVETACNGLEALEKLRAESFDTMLLDLLMPVMDGFEVLECVKNEVALESVPIIVISADDDIESVVRCIEMGAADYLPKPFNPVVLRARIGACVGKKRSRDRETALFDELQQRYRQLQELQQLRDDLTHMIVHDLRTPLTSLLAGLELVPMVGELNVEQVECLEMATDGGKGLLAMINELLDISKMEDGSLQLDMTACSPVHLWERTRVQIEPLAQEKTLQIRTEIPAALPELWGDEDKLVRVLVNLCSNAIKFTPHTGQITVGAALDGDTLEGDGLQFWVRDTGEGIPPEHQERIFEKFHQVETRKSGRKMSTGLGLTFCKMAIEKHNGRIWVESEPHQGSLFSFVIPLAP